MMISKTILTASRETWYYFTRNHTSRDFIQGLLELLWTVYSEGKLQSCLRLRTFQNSFNKDKSVSL